MLIVIYGRVSTEDQATKGYSLPEQLRACRERAQVLAGAEGASVVEFEDDMSGDFLERPGLQAALELVRRDKPDYFVCLDPDRFARRLMLQLLVTDIIEGAGCKLEFVQHNYQDTPEGRLFYQLRGAISEFEKAKILERTRRGAKGKAKAGGLPHIIRLYGYDFQKGAGRMSAQEVLIPNEHESQWVRTMYSWCANERMGPQSIASRLNSMGVATKTQRSMWAHTTVRRILRNPTYATGQLALFKADHQGIFAARRLAKTVRTTRGMRLTPRRKPKDQWHYVQIKPIVDEVLWRRAQQVLDGFRVGGRAAPNKQRLLTGLGRCGLCGGPLYYLTGRKIVCGSRYRHYWVPGAEPTGCTLPAKPFPAVERAVWEVVKSWLLNPALLETAANELMAEQAENLNRSAISEQEIALLDAEIRTKQQEVERLGVLYSRGLWPADRALEALEGANRELQSLQARRSALAEPQAVVERPGTNPVLDLLQNSDWLQEVRGQIDDITDEQKRELLTALVDHYVMMPSGRGKPPDITVVPHW